MLLFFVFIVLKHIRGNVQSMERDLKKSHRTKHYGIEGKLRFREIKQDKGISMSGKMRFLFL